MATYAIGDIQGCYDELIALLDEIDFNADSDQLWFVGDLVNRGPRSLATLRHVHALRDNAVIVLGNHDLHLLACRHLDRMKPKKKDTTQEILDASDCDKLLDWLRTQQLAHYDPDLEFTMVHAGLPPAWDTAQTLVVAKDVEARLAGNELVQLLDNMYGNEPNRWDSELYGWKRCRFVINALTRLRFSDVDGRIDMTFKGPLGSQPDNLKPWFELNQRPRGERIVFGHWSSLRLTQAQIRQFQVYPLDTGAVWGGALTALRLDDLAVFSVPSTVCLPIR